MSTNLHVVSYWVKAYSQTVIGQAGKRRYMRASLCHHCDDIRSRDVIGHVTIRLSVVEFLYVLNRNQSHISLLFSRYLASNIMTSRRHHRRHIRLGRLTQYCVKDGLTATRNVGDEAF